MTMKSTACFMSLKTDLIQLLIDKPIELDDNAQISFPQNLVSNENKSVLLQVSEEIFSIDMKD